MLNLILAAAIGFGASPRPIHTQASLVLDSARAKPGDTVIAGIRLRMEPEWHTYWTNCGDSGQATGIAWDLPAGVTAGEIQWPVPKKLPPDDFTTYVYEKEVVLLVPLKLASDLPPGPRELTAHVSWLECRELCLSNGAVVHATLNVGPESEFSPNADLIHAWQKNLPRSGAGLPVRAWWEKTPEKNQRPLILEWTPSNSVSEADFYPYDAKSFEVLGVTEQLPADAGRIRLRKPVKKFEGDWPKQISGLLVEKTADGRIAYEITAPIVDSGPRASEPMSSAQAVAKIGTLWKNLFYAFIGGLILNIMPCVLPVIALKVLGFIGEAGSDRRRLRRFGLVYAAGVLASFLALAAVAIGLKAAGQRVGWGMQFNNPYFLMAITVLMTLIALNLFGVFEVTLGGRALNAAATLASRHGTAGAFFNGLLATVLATSCTAPYFGAAVGFALQPGVSNSVLVLMTLTAGIGMAAPYVLLTWQPAWLKFLPKPGPWMEKFKVAMGFPMLATAVWLCSLVAIFYDDRTWAFVFFLIVIAVAAWVYGQFIQRSSRRRGVAFGVIAVLLAAGYVWILEGQLRWREPITDTQASAGGGAGGIIPEGIRWQPWSPEAIAKAQAENRPVLVDFTAKWCLTCQINIKPVLGSQAVRKKLDELNAVALVADYTRRPDVLTDELYKHGRAGVPLVLVYPKHPEAPPIVLPEALTPGIVLEALDRAAKL